MARAAQRGVALCLPEVPLEVRAEFLQLATRCGNFRAASFALSEVPAAKELRLFSIIDLLALNREEAAGLVGYQYSSNNAKRFLSDCASILQEAQPAIRIVISVGAEGVYAFENESWDFQPPLPVEAIATAGAGDALLAGVISGMASGLPLISRRSVNNAAFNEELCSAIELGVLLASFSLSSPDTIHFDANLASLEEFASDLKPTK